MLSKSTLTALHNSFVRELYPLSVWYTWQGYCRYILINTSSTIWLPPQELHCQNEDIINVGNLSALLTKLYIEQRPYSSQRKTYSYIFLCYHTMFVSRRCLLTQKIEPLDNNLACGLPGIPNNCSQLSHSWLLKKYTLNTYNCPRSQSPATCMYHSCLSRTGHEGGFSCT